MGMYRPHSDSQENFTSYLENLLNGSISARTNLIIMGDFNINLIQTSDSDNNFLNSVHFKKSFGKTLDTYQVRGTNIVQAVDNKRK